MKTEEQSSPTEIGFTLIEVVLALTIFALMATILYGAFSLGHSAVEKTHGSFDRNQRLRSFGDLLGSYVRSAYPYRASLQAPSFFFQGEADHLNFISSFSRSMGGRGMAKVLISWEAGDDGKGALKLEEIVPVRFDDENGEQGQRDGMVLQEDARELRFAYLNPQPEEEKWEERWDGREQRTLPRAVRLTYKTGSGKEVRWVIPIMLSVLAQ